jgi:hypothetical protein
VARVIGPFGETGRSGDSRLAISQGGGDAGSYGEPLRRPVVFFKAASAKNVLKTLLLSEGIPFGVDGQVNEMDITGGQRFVQPLEDLGFLIQRGIDERKRVWWYIMLLRTLLQTSQ